MNYQTATGPSAEYCLATFAAYGACIRAPGHPMPHADDNERPFYQNRPVGTTHPISAVLAVLHAERGPVSRADLARKTGLDLKTTIYVAERGARSGHILRSRSGMDGLVYYAPREPGTSPRAMWGES